MINHPQINNLDSLFIQAIKNQDVSLVEKLLVTGKIQDSFFMNTDGKSVMRFIEASNNDGLKARVHCYLEKLSHFSSRSFQELKTTYHTEKNNEKEPSVQQIKPS